jgi:RNA polymerase sigma factor (sigma-70 family)
VVKTIGINAAGRDLQTLFDAGVLGGLSDGQLLDRFVARHEEAVFEAIVRRHGAMVWGVCRRVLQDHHDAEDAFQATFLVLARRAAAVMPREKVGNWLFGVAYQTARKARATRARRRMRESQVPDLPEPETMSHARGDDLTETLDQELNRLPEKYRMPIVLCELEGRTHRDAADQLGWPIGTLSTRLSRAKAMLAKRLTRRGHALPGGSMALWLARDGAPAGIPPHLVHATAEAASLFATGQAVSAGAVSADVVALARGVIQTMLPSKFKKIAAILLVLGLAGASLRYAGARAGGHGDPMLLHRFRATVHEVINDAKTRIVQIDLETRPGVQVHVVADKAGHGGGSVFVPKEPKGTSHVRVLVLADHIDWKAGWTSVFKFLIKLDHRGNMTFSREGPMPPGKTLADVVAVPLQSGTYEYGVATALATFRVEGGVTYGLLVEEPK